MLWPESDRIRNHALRAALSALFSLGCIAASFAQTEPPLTVPLAGGLPTASSGCDTGIAGGANLFGGSSLYGNVSAPAKVRPAGDNTTSDLSVPLYSTANPGDNIPLYSNPLAGDNVPLYSAPNAGSNTPLYSTSSLSNNYTLGGTGGDVGSGGNASPALCHSGIPLGEWLIYPSIRLYSIYSDNLFLSPIAPINALSFGASPSVTAQWTNGIHTTTIYANVDTDQYPTNNLINTFDRKATFTQTYAPLPDLTFTVLGDYTHTTVTSSLTNSIPTAISTPVTTPTLLPNGNFQLPNGEIVSPTGQIVGNINGPTSANGTSVVNPYDQYTGTATVSKIFNGGILTLGGSAAQTDYQFTQNFGPTAFTSFTTKTFTEDGSVALGPLLYAYSNGVYSMRRNSNLVDPNSDVYRVDGGVGTRQFGLFRGSAYFGYQGSNSDGSGSAGGLIYGGKVSYYPSLAWTITAALDETINHAPGNAISTQALSVNSPEQIPLSSSTRITTPSLQTQYQIAPQWTVNGNFSYTQIYYYGSPRLDNAWQADAQLNYEIWRNMTLGWEYEYTDIISNVPGSSAQRNYLMMSANYRF
jgi:hypothetical protein